MNDHTHADCERHAHPATRRRIMTGGAAVVAAAIAGCFDGGGSAEAPDPTDISAGDQCEVCGMVIADHPGPNGQVFYADESPDGHENPARFDSLRGCMFPYHFDRKRRDWTAAAIYVTDYSAVDYELSTQADRTYISSYTAPESLVDGREASYVVGSGIEGAMGPDFIPFADGADADSFAADHGGEVLAFEDITVETL